MMIYIRYVEIEPYQLHEILATCNIVEKVNWRVFYIELF